MVCIEISTLYSIIVPVIISILSNMGHSTYSEIQFKLFLFHYLTKNKGQICLDFFLIFPNFLSIQHYYRVLKIRFYSFFSKMVVFLKAFSKKEITLN